MPRRQSLAQLRAEIAGHRSWLLSLTGGTDPLGGLPRPMGGGVSPAASAASAAQATHAAMQAARARGPLQPPSGVLHSGIGAAKSKGGLFGYGLGWGGYEGAEWPGKQRFAHIPQWRRGNQLTTAAFLGRQKGSIRIPREAIRGTLAAERLIPGQPAPELKLTSDIFPIVHGPPAGAVSDWISPNILEKTKGYMGVSPASYGIPQHVWSEKTWKQRAGVEAKIWREDTRGHQFSNLSQVERRNLGMRTLQQQGFVTARLIPEQVISTSVGSITTTRQQLMGVSNIFLGLDPAGPPRGLYQSTLAWIDASTGAKKMDAKGRLYTPVVQWRQPGGKLGRLNPLDFKKLAYTRRDMALASGVIVPTRAPGISGMLTGRFLDPNMGQFGQLFEQLGVPGIEARTIGPQTSVATRGNLRAFLPELAAGEVPTRSGFVWAEHRFSKAQAGLARERAKQVLMNIEGWSLMSSSLYGGPKMPKADVLKELAKYEKVLNRLGPQQMVEQFMARVHRHVFERGAATVYESAITLGPGMGFMKMRQGWRAVGNIGPEGQRRSFRYGGKVYGPRSVGELAANLSRRQRRLLVSGAVTAEAMVLPKTGLIRGLVQAMGFVDPDISIQKVAASIGAGKVRPELGVGMVPTKLRSWLENMYLAESAFPGVAKRRGPRGLLGGGFGRPGAAAHAAMMRNFDKVGASLIFESQAEALRLIESIEASRASGPLFTRGGRMGTNTLGTEAGPRRQFVSAGEATPILSGRAGAADRRAFELRLQPMGAAGQVGKILQGRAPAGGPVSLALTEADLSLVTELGRAGANVRLGIGRGVYTLRDLAVSETHIVPGGARAAAAGGLHSGTTFLSRAGLDIGPLAQALRRDNQWVHRPGLRPPSAVARQLRESVPEQVRQAIARAGLSSAEQVIHPRGPIGSTQAAGYVLQRMVRRRGRAPSMSAIVGGTPRSTVRAMSGMRTTVGGFNAKRAAHRLRGTYFGGWPRMSPVRTRMPGRTPIPVVRPFRMPGRPAWPGRATRVGGRPPRVRPARMPARGGAPQVRPIVGRAMGRKGPMSGGGVRGVRGINVAAVHRGAAAAVRGRRAAPRRAPVPVVRPFAMPTGGAAAAGLPPRAPVGPFAAGVARIASGLSYKQIGIGGVGALAAASIVSSFFEDDAPSGPPMSTMGSAPLPPSVGPVSPMGRGSLPPPSPVLMHPMGRQTNESIMMQGRGMPVDIMPMLQETGIDSMRVSYENHRGLGDNLSMAMHYDNVLQNRLWMTA